MPLRISPSVTSESDILEVYNAHDQPTHFTLVLGVFSFEQIAHVGVNLSRYLELFDCEIMKLLSKYSNLCDHGT